MYGYQIANTVQVISHLYSQKRSFSTMPILLKRYTPISQNYITQTFITSTNSRKYQTLNILEFLPKSDRYNKRVLFKTPTRRIHLRMTQVAQRSEANNENLFSTYLLLPSSAFDGFTSRLLNWPFICTLFVGMSRFFPCGRYRGWKQNFLR